MIRLAVGLHSQTVTLGAEGVDAEAVLAFVCDGLRTRPTAHSRLELRSASAGEFQLLRDGVLVEVPGSRAAAVEVLMRELSIALVWDYREGLALHAAALEIEGGAVLFPAVSGTGKSTLAVYLAARGLRFLSDELVFIPSGEEQVHPLCRPAHLKPGSVFLLEVFPQLAHSPEVLLSGEGIFLAPAAFPAHGGAPLQLRAIVFPSYVPDAACELESLRSGVAGFSLLGALVNARNLPGLGVAEAARLASRVPVARLRYGDLGEAWGAIVGVARRAQHS